MNRPFYFFIFLLTSLQLLSFVSNGQEDSSLTNGAAELPGVVVTATRQKEKILQSPVSIEKLTSESIRRSAQPSFFDAIENVKGIQMITPSLGFKVINARGFTNTTNVRFVQMVDGMDIQAPHIGAPMANALGPGDLDINSVEIIPGSSSAIYGMNAINGTANFITKDPFIYQGVSISQRTGVNHINDDNRSAVVFSETALRWAKSYKNKFAFKINAVYSAGTDWYADNRMDLNPAANASTNLTGVENPGKDLVNVYADESSNRRTLTLNGKQYVASRTGYAEKDVSDYALANFKSDVTLAYRVKKAELSYTFRFAHSNTIYQRTNRFRLDNYITGQHAFALKTNSIVVRAYANTENTGNSYNIRSMAENIDRSFKTDDTWYRDFSNQFNTSVSNGVAIPQAMTVARNYADNARPAPHTTQIEELIDKLRTINDWDRGAALQVDATMYNAEMQHDLSKDLLKEVSRKHKL
ncbi:MAG: TonB-dependent receptor, partial [Bacteroidota bacterium]|nr:TonB-dependent receptor [Bacteroidota bacterium]